MSHSGTKKSATWKISDQPSNQPSNHAVVCLGSLTASLTPDTPQLGFTKVTVESQPVEGSLLRVELSEGEEECVVPTREEIFIRGSDLVATYSATKELLFKTRIYFQGNHSGGYLSDLQENGEDPVSDFESKGLETLSVVVSTQTDQLESYPTVLIRSTLPAGGEFTILDYSPEPDLYGEWFGYDAELYPGLEPCAILYRIPGEKFSYLEAIHPSDFIALEISTDKETAGLQIAWPMFGPFLEKGVIRRGRIMGAFLPQENDLQTAHRLMLQWLHSKQPITT